jgi:hypothetical protein
VVLQFNNMSNGYSHWWIISNPQNFQFRIILVFWHSQICFFLFLCFYSFSISSIWLTLIMLLALSSMPRKKDSVCSCSHFTKTINVHSQLSTLFNLHWVSCSVLYTKTFLIFVTNVTINQQSILGTVAQSSPLHIPNRLVCSANLHNGISPAVDIVLTKQESQTLN